MILKYVCLFLAQIIMSIYTRWGFLMFGRMHSYGLAERARTPQTILRQYETTSTNHKQQVTVGKKWAKIGQTYLWDCLLALGHVYNQFMENIWPKAPEYCSASIWNYNFSSCLYENLQTLDFYDLWIFGRGPEPTNHLCVLLETPGYFK